MHSPPAFPRFLERKLGKEFSAKLRFASAPVGKGLGKRNRLPRLWAFLFRRGGYHPPALLGYKRVRGDFAFGRVSFSSMRKKPKNRRGRLTGIFNALSRRHPDPHFFYGGATKGLCISIRRGLRTGRRSSRRPLRSRWRLCRLTDAAYPLRVLPLCVG